MIKYLIILLSIFFIISCSLYNYPMDLNSPDEIAEWIQLNIKYKPDRISHWQQPEETLEKATGDCEDFSILFLFLCQENLGLYGDIVLSTKGKNQHAHARLFNGYEFYKLGSEWKFLISIPYDMAIFYCTLQDPWD